MLAAFLVLLLGFGLLALSQERHHERVFEPNLLVARIARGQRAIGFVAIGVALALCTAASGAGFGSLLWVVLMGAAAMAIALTLTWYPRALRPLGWLVTGRRAARPHDDT